VRKEDGRRVEKGVIKGNPSGKVSLRPYVLRSAFPGKTSVGQKQHA